MEKDTEFKYSSEWIHKLEAERHWQYYHIQQAFMDGNINKDEQLIEIGVGSSFTANYLKSKSFNVTTLDIDKDKHPDIVSNIVTDDFPQGFDVVLAFEVFEHIAYQSFLDILGKLKSRGVKKVFFSVPYNIKVWFDFDIRIHVFGRICFQIATRRNRLTTDHHKWEIKYKNHSLKNLKTDIETSGYRIKNDERKYSQHFFYLELEE